MNMTDKIKAWLVYNKKCLIYGICGLIIGLVVMRAMWPTRIAELEDGTQPVVEINGEIITADDLYNELKQGSGLTALLNLIDNKILENMYDVEDEAAEYAKNQSEYYYSIYESYYGYTKNEFLDANGFADEDAFITYLKDDYVVQKYYQEYLENLLTDKEIEEYYDESVFGDKTVNIYYSAEEENDLESVRDALKDGATFDEIKSEYPEITATELGTVSFNSTPNYSDAFNEQLLALETDEYSRVFEDDTYGHVVMSVTSVADKPSLEDAKDGIVEVLSAEKNEEDENLYYKAFIELREENGIKFSDTSLQEQYEKYKKQYN